MELRLRGVYQLHSPNIEESYVAVLDWAYVRSSGHVTRVVEFHQRKAISIPFFGTGIWWTSAVSI